MEEDLLAGMRFEIAPGKWLGCQGCVKYHEPSITNPDACDDLLMAMVSHKDYPDGSIECLEFVLKEEVALGARAQNR